MQQNKSHGQTAKRAGIAQKIDAICRSARLEEIPEKFRPAVIADDYYFVSYSHKDYKSVYPDMLRLQEEGLEFWYDGGMVPGISWKEIARRYINRYCCRGVIFYLSENSLASAAIHEEIEFARRHGKDFIPIVLPLARDRELDGKTVRAGEYISTEKMLRLLSEQGIQIAPDKRDSLFEILADDVLVLPLQEDASVRARKIREKLKKQPLLAIERDTVTSINDLDAISIRADDFLAPIAPETISACAFSNCRGLASAELPPSVRFIEGYAFYNCWSLKDIDLRRTRLLAVRTSCFQGCRSLESASFPPQTHTLGKEAFAYCSSLRKVLFPEHLERLEEGAFRACCSLAEIALPPALRTIGDEAFENCISLREIQFPKHLRTIGRGAFGGCEALCSALLPKELHAVGAEAFAGCASLETIELPAGVTVLEEGTFADCTALTHVLLPAALVRIGKECFVRCDALEGIRFPAALQNIALWAFCDCGSLEEVLFGGADTQIGERAFANCSALKGVALPTRLKTIAEATFYACSSLRTVCVPASLSEIGAGAFFGCFGLQAIRFFGTTAQWKQVEKGKDWDGETGNYTVFCTDGELGKGF